MIWIQNESFSTKWYSTSYASCIYTFLPLAITRSYFAELLEPLLRRCFLHGSALINMTLFCAWQKFWRVLFIRADDTHANWNFRKASFECAPRYFDSRASRWEVFIKIPKISVVHGNFKQGVDLSQLQLRLHPPLHSSSRRCDTLKWKTEKERTPHLFVDERQITLFECLFLLYRQFKKKNTQKYNQLVLIKRNVEERKQEILIWIYSYKYIQ